MAKLDISFVSNSNCKKCNGAGTLTVQDIGRFLCPCVWTITKELTETLQYTKEINTKTQQYTKEQHIDCLSKVIKDNYPITPSYHQRKLAERLLAEEMYRWGARVPEEVQQSTLICKYCSGSGMYVNEKMRYTIVCINCNGTGQA